MKLFHRPAHTISTSLHREAYPRAARWKLVILGAVIGGLLTGGGTFAIARINASIAHVHAKHRLEHLHAARTSCFGMLANARLFETFPAAETARCEYFTRMLAPPARASCMAAITASSFTPEVVADRAACVTALRESPRYLGALRNHRGSSRP